MALVPSREQIIECIGIVQPELMVSVPALFNRIYDGVFKNIRSESALKQKLISYAFQTARKRNELLEFGKPVGSFLEFQHKLFDKIVFSKIRAKFGGKLQYFAAGGAATSLPVLHFFEDVGIPILEGYGLTETSPIITCSGQTWDLRRLGTVGVPVIGVTVRIVDPETLEELPADTDGEVTCSGPNVMKQYRNNPAANEEVFYYVGDKRYFRTGDMGRMLEGKFLKITGRIKEKYKLENGKYVVPAPLEDTYCRSLFVAQTFIFGDNKPKNVLLVVPDWAEVFAWLRTNVKVDSSLAEFIPSVEKMVTVPGKPAPATSEQEIASGLLVFEHPAVQKLMEEELTNAGESVKGYERPYRWAPLGQPFSQENQMLTPKMSLRRNIVLATYQPLIDGLYEGTKGYFASAAK
jgi:long-chain acyl-CoA synthetase